MEDVAAGKFGNSVYLAVEILRRDDPRHVAAIRILKALILDTGRQVVRLRCGAEHVENPGNRMHAERPLGQGIGRSEEHTSELQSLMRISYAVFCLKKKKTKTQAKYHKQHTNDITDDTF